MGIAKSITNVHRCIITMQPCYAIMFQVIQYKRILYAGDTFVYNNTKELNLIRRILKSFRVRSVKIP